MNMQMTPTLCRHCRLQTLFGCTTTRTIISEKRNMEINIIVMRLPNASEEEEL